ncbi:glycoside hydrolase family 6 protein [Streptomyces sp. NPDC049906]|uniref:glycoside hydrolase family 6 protein n=1 Tax=Streptomyces sp. NPDC049906 TaxID=3155656 RepID=UPI00343E3CA7
MVVTASVVALLGTVAGTLDALEDRGRTADEARPEITTTPLPPPAPTTPPPAPAPSPTPPPPSPTPSSSPSPSPSPSPSRTATRAPEPPAPPPTTSAPPTSSAPATRAEPVSAALYRHPASQVLDWLRANPGDPRAATIASRIGDQPAAVWFADYTPDTITARVRAVTSGGADRDRVPVVVPYAIPDRDCGGASQGGAPDTAAYDAWIDRFAAGLGDDEVIVVLEPDALALVDCLPADARERRYRSLARAGRVLKAANPEARVYFDAGHSGWHAPATIAERLRAAGAGTATASDGIFTNVSNFHRTTDETAFARAVLDALSGAPGLGAVVDTSRNGNGAPADGAWCDPAGRALGRPPTLRTGQARIDAYLWVKLPGESDGCRGRPGRFTPSYAYELARNGG